MSLTRAIDKILGLEPVSRVSDDHYNDYSHLLHKHGKQMALALKEVRELIDKPMSSSARLLALYEWGRKVDKQFS